jgi:hypothetical protein
LQKAGNNIKSLTLDTTSALRSPAATAFDAVHIVQAFITVETDVGKGDGMVRLVQDGGVWKVFTLFTYLKELRGYEERVGRRRPNGVEHGEHASQKNWADRRREESAFEGGMEPTVIIMGEFSFDLSSVPAGREMHPVGATHFFTGVLVC